MSSIRKQISDELSRRNGILNLIPSWVARTLLLPGKRLKLHPNDLYAYGADHGPLVERWVASVSRADNGKLTMPNEGLSYINIGFGSEKLLLQNAIDDAGDLIIGQKAMNESGGLTAFAKIYDFARPLPFHIHYMEKDAKEFGVEPKPEAYYYPRQLNSIDYEHPYTFFGLTPSTTKEDLKVALEQWGKYGDNGICEFSVAYRLKLGTGWNIPAGILHAPGALATYEPQRVSDTSMFMQSMVYDKYIERDLLTKYVPEGKEYDFDFMIDKIDWAANMDPDFKQNHYCEPVPAHPENEMAGYYETFVCYGSDEFCAKELTVFPGEEVTVTDSASYGLLMMEGYGTINGNEISSPSMIRVGNLTSDEMFVTASAAQEGVRIKNPSQTDNIVMLKNFSGNCEESKCFLRKY
ncbi:hypothetical protein [Christensenella timonensis]|uniref:hypothetical protein n=1 Tax=Christensenella timonensis TaxID=1816678 RepID=UPI00082E0B08|nr:hypothetical protein [Christensenella timonensis]